MDLNDLYCELLSEITDQRLYLADKPQESPEGALRALWFLAAGECRAVERCLEGDLPYLSEAAMRCLRALVYTHMQGMPLAHLTGRQCFMEIEMLAGPEALIPRKETEILGYAAFDALQTVVAANGHAQVIDLCTGCGNLALALAYHEPNCQVFAADLSPEAVALAQRNAAHLALQHRVTFSVGDLFASFEDERFVNQVDMVVCNPPYISSQRVGEMPAEVSDYEPRLAFDGGPFGVSILVRLITEALRYLKPGGWLCFEVGLGQGDLIRRRLERNGAYSDIDVRFDTDGNSRVLLARRV
ncbi:MAG: peptide chain release factor N(5)-glutamine methyltransferase [Anaerolineae bacterium]|nr:peptide chain release factor N(5)-glutamine methyltransferase [Anaerolineae bacterium]